MSPLAPDEAVSQLSHAQFEKFYERYCYLRNQPVDGPLPEPVE